MVYNTIGDLVIQ